MVDPDCWFCGQPIREGDPAEVMPPRTIAVHAACLKGDVNGNRDGNTIGGRKAA
jgi:hypothetical protein